MTRRQEELFFEKIETQRESDFSWAILDEADRHIGFIGLHAINWRNRWATGGLFIGERSAWGRGYATDAVRIRTKFAFGELGLHRIEGHTIGFGSCKGDELRSITKVQPNEPTSIGDSSFRLDRAAGPGQTASCS